MSVNKLNSIEIERIHKIVIENPTYGGENKLITNCFNIYPLNNEVETVAMKIGLIDITNSTNISRHKRKISVLELANIIVNIEDIDNRIKNGDPEIVNIISKSNGNINLFSFASKYCCYHNCNYYRKDDYSIFDTILKNHLTDYFDDISKSQIEKWRKDTDYKSYNDYITRKLDEAGIFIINRKRKFDHFIWYQNR